MDGALDVLPERRAAYLDDASRRDPAATEVARSLLDAAERTGCMDAPASSMATPIVRSVDAGDVTPGARIGSYRVVRELGRGGMGTVYLGERADRLFEQRVALKVLPAWSSNDERHVRRFVEERRMLATLDHPDIARIFDGGVTPDGRPWFAMELVDGVAIDRFCESHRLDNPGRLQLFRRVCAAVQYAHRNLIVHRDLKANNILVTPDRGVKLLDFGIAKLLSDDIDDAPPSLTLTGELLLTPLTASPEQLRGERVTTASDVYSLGVLLHRLVTGQYPYRVASRDPRDIAHAVLHQEPVRQSRGDLDVIIATAMQMDPNLRYGSAAELASDVERFLAGQPLHARAEGAWSRGRKFARRHRLAVATGTGVALIVVAFAVVSTVQALRIRAQAQRIAQERDRAQRVSDFLGRLFRASDPYSVQAAGAGLSARDLLDSGSVLIDRELAGQPEDRAHLLLVMGRAYLGLGMRDRARRLLEVSVTIRRRALPDGRQDLAESLDALGRSLFELGALDDAERAYREALDARRGYSASDDARLARTLNGFAAVLRAQGRFALADSMSRESVAVDEPRASENPLDLAESLHGLAEARRESGRGNAAELHRRSLALRLQAPTVAPVEVARAVIDLAASLDSTHDSEADSLFRRGLTQARLLLGRDHPDLALGEVRHAAVLRRRGRAAEAEQLYRHALRVAEAFPRVHPVRASALLGLGQLFQESGDQARSEDVSRQALAIRQTILSPDHPHLADAHHRLGLVILARGRFMEAERYLVRAHQAYRRGFGDEDTRTRAALADLLALYVASGRPREGVAYRTRIADGSLRDGEAHLTVKRFRGEVAVLPFDVPPGDIAIEDLSDVVQSLLRRAVNLDDSSGAGGAARLTLRGTLVGNTRHLVIEARSATGRASPRLHAREEGPADSLPYMVDRLAVRLLALDAARDSAEFAAFDKTTLAALKAYLTGSEAMRRGQLTAASEWSLERASFLDSTFVAPKLGLAAIAELIGAQGVDEDWRFEAAWAHRHELGDADRAILIAHLGPRYPLPSSLRERIDAARYATKAAPHRVESWFMLGENLQRFGSLADVPGWLNEARAALLRARAIDSTHAMVIDRLMLLAAWAGDREAVRLHASQYLAYNANSESAVFAAWLRARVLDDTSALASIRRNLPSTATMSPQRILMWSQEFGIGVDDAARAAAALDHRATGSAQRNLAMNRNVRLYLNAGQPESARRLLAETEGTFGPQQGVTKDDFRIFAALYWDGDRSDASAAARRIEALVASSRASASSACALAHWRIGEGQLPLADSALRYAYRVTQPLRTEPRLALPVCLASAMALREQAAETVANATLERLDSLLVNALSARDMVYEVGNVVAARLFASRGDAIRALRITRRRATWNAFLSTLVLQEARAAATAGDREGAARAYRHFLSMRPAPEPPLREQVALVQRELRRLDLEVSVSPRR